MCIRPTTHSEVEATSQSSKCRVVAGPQQESAFEKKSNISSSTICQNLPQHIFWTPCPEISHHLSPEAILRQMSSQGIQRLSKALDFQCLTTLSASTASHVPALSAEVARRAEGGVERLEVPDWCPTGVREWVDCGHGNNWKHGKAMETHCSHGRGGETNRETVLHLITAIHRDAETRTTLNSRNLQNT